MTATLELREAVPLGYALVTRVADVGGFRVLGIKGPVSDTYGLREPRQSADIDALVEPEAFDAFRDLLVEFGWTVSSKPSAAFVLGRHSIELRHPLWPCEIDLHSWYPGFLGEPAEVFDQLWSRREPLEIAGSQVSATDRLGNFAITGLHALANGEGRRAELDYLSTWAKGNLAPAELNELAMLAEATGSAHTLAPLLGPLGVVPPRILRDEARALAEWEVRCKAKPHDSATAWVLEIRRATWHRKPGVLWRALWATPAEVAVHDPAALSGSLGLAAARLRRLRRGLRHLRGAIPVLVKSRRASRSEPRS